MLLLDAIPLSDADKLDVLQRLDQFRRWNSLDDKRYCLCCSKIITGYEIQVIGGTRGHGPDAHHLSHQGLPFYPDGLGPAD